MGFYLLGLEHVPIVFDCASVKAVSNRFIFQQGMHKGTSKDEIKLCSPNARLTPKTSNLTGMIFKQ